MCKGSWLKSQDFRLRDCIGKGIDKAVFIAILCQSLRRYATPPFTQGRLTLRFYFIKEKIKLRKKPPYDEGGGLAQAKTEGEICGVRFERFVSFISYSNEALRISPSVASRQLPRQEEPNTEALFCKRKDAT